MQEPGELATIIVKVDILLGLMKAIQDKQEEQDRTLISQSAILDDIKLSVAGDVIGQMNFDDKVNRLNVKMDNLNTAMKQLDTKFERLAG